MNEVFPATNATSRPSAIGRGRMLAMRWEPLFLSDWDRALMLMMERYAAFTEWMGLKRRFRVWHEPWRQGAVDVEIEENSLMELTGDWALGARYIGANYSPGARDVWMGRPAFAGNYKFQTANHKETRREND